MTQSDVTTTELAILEVLWDRQPATIRSITDQLYPDGGASHYATVQKLLERLETKGYVRRKRSVFPHQFRAKIDRSKLISHRLREIADSLCGGAVGPLLTHLVEDPRLSDGDVDQLKQLVERLAQERDSQA